MNWADDVDDDVSPDAPRIEEKDEGNGVRVITEYKVNAEGKKVKVSAAVWSERGRWKSHKGMRMLVLIVFRWSPQITRRIRRTLVTTKVNAAEAQRKQWTKFGEEKGRPSGPHSSTTSVGENVLLKMSAGSRNTEPEPDQMDSMREQLSRAKITCRLCKGDHLTYKCPYRDTLEAIPGAADTPEGEGAMTPAAQDPTNPAVAASAGGKYVPVHLRGGARGAGERMSGGPGGMMNRDEMPTLRVTNLSDDAEEEDLRNIFGRYGYVQRVYVGRDRETGECKGYAFVSFLDRDDADKARQKVDGRGYNNLILSVNWSQPRAERPQ